MAIVPALVSVVNGAKTLHYARALDPEGENWPAPQLISPLGEAAAQSSPLLEVRPGQNPRVFFGRRTWLHDYGTYVMEALDPLGASFGERVKVSSAFAGRMDLVRTGNRSRLLLNDNWETSGLHYVCEESGAAGWLPTQAVEPDLYSGRNLGLLIHNGLPLMLYTVELTDRYGLRARQALDSLGEEWGPEMVLDPQATAGSKLSVIVSVGRPMLVYSDDAADKLCFASFH